MKKFFGSVKNKAAVAGALALGAVVPAYAALPTAVDTAFTDFQSNAVALIDKGWPLLIAVFGGMVLMKLFKKVGNKAT
jgi:hypothetical protein